MNFQITATGTANRLGTKWGRPFAIAGLGLSIAALITGAALLFEAGDATSPTPPRMPQVENLPVSISPPTMTYYLVDTQEYADVIQLSAERGVAEQAELEPRSTWSFAVFVVDTPEAEATAMDAINAAYLREIDGGAQQVKVVDLRFKCIEC